MKKTLAIDFDGVLHDLKTPSPYIKKMGIPIEGSEESMRLLYRRYKLVVFTCRGGEKSRQHVIDWLHFYHIPFDEVTDIKPNAQAYIDDRALPFTDWSSVMRTLNRYPRA